MADQFQLKAILSAVDNLSPVLKGVQSVAKSTRKYLGDVGSAAGKLSGQIGLPMAAISGVLGGFSIVAVKNAVVGFADLGESIKKGSLKAGTSVQDYQRLKYVFEQAGVSVDAMENSMGKLNLNIGNAAAGKNQVLASLMAKMGISMRDVNGQARTAVDLLPQLSDTLVKNTNPAVRNRMAMAMFGKTYAEILPLLVEGSKKIKDGMSDFDLIKSPLDDKAVDDAKNLGNEFKKFDLVVKGFQGTIAKELAPIIEDVAKGTTKWWIENKKLVGTEVSKMAKELSGWIKSINWDEVIASAKGFAASLGKVVDFLGGTKSALIGLAIFMNMQTIAAFVGLGGSVMRLVGFLGGPLLGVLRSVWTVMMANPIALLVAAVIGLAVIIYQNWDNIVAYVTAAWDRIKAVFGVSFFDGIIQLWLESWQGLANGIIGIVKTILPEKLMPEAMRNFKFTFATDRAAALAMPITPEAARASVSNMPLAANRFSLGQSVADGFSRPSLLQPAGRVKADGKIDININGLPPGSRIDQWPAGDLPLNLNAGYSSAALGLPY